MWVDTVSGFIEAVCKSAGHKTVEQKPGWCSSVFIVVTLTFLDVSQLQPLTSWHQFGRRRLRKKEAGLVVISSHVAANN